MLRQLDTPCIGICSTIYGDEVCRGCKRFYHEIIDWNAYSREAKDRIFERLETFIIDATSDKLMVTDSDLLRAQLDKLNIRYHPDTDPLCWAYYLLREGHNRIKDLKKYGINVHPNYADATPTELYHGIDSALNQTSYDSFSKHMTDGVRTIEKID